MQTPADRAYDARRSDRQASKGTLWRKSHPQQAREYKRKYRAEKGRREGVYAQMICGQRNPITVYSDNVLVTCDYHIPFQDDCLIDYMLSVAEDNGVYDLIVAGDFWDCDNYSRHSRLTWLESFQTEVKEVGKVLEKLVDQFDTIYFCRGNHEKRWIDMNTGLTGMEELFAMTKIVDGYEVTLDDHLKLVQKNQDWLICHPKNFRQVNLSVARDLSAKFHCNVISGHGHQFAQGWDRSGKYRVADGGGLFDRDSIDYLRETTCHPVTRNGFYLVQDDDLIPFEP